VTVLEKLMSIFEGFDFEKLGERLPSAESLMNGLSGWMALLVLAGPLLMLGFGVYYLFFAPKEANHAMGYRFFYAMSRVEVWQHAQRLAGVAYGALGAVLFLIMGLITLSFGVIATPDMVWLAVKCVIWEVVLVIMATLAVDILIVVLYDFKGEPRKSSEKLLKANTGKYRKVSRPATPAQRASRQSPTGTQRK
jgi:hypothetical protein